MKSELNPRPREDQEGFGDEERPGQIGILASVHCLLAFTLMGTLSACDPLYGVTRLAPLPVDPTPECVERVLRNIPAIDSFDHKHLIGGYPLTWTGFKAPDVIESFSYRGAGGIFGTLQYTKDYRGRLKLAQTSYGLRRPPPQEIITATRPVMHQIEIALATDCGVSGLEAHVTEHCAKVACGPL